MNLSSYLIRPSFPSKLFGSHRGSKSWRRSRNGWLGDDVKYGGEYSIAYSTKIKSIGQDNDSQSIVSKKQGYLGIFFARGWVRRHPSTKAV